MAFKRFTKSHASIFSKFGYSVRRHIKEGISLPANDGFLSPNVCLHS